ncbi:MAG: PAS domain-containing protein [Acidobacteria bacterium]|nr:PAS domain-containing protein [Acidobacteriota bacterium]
MKKRKKKPAEESVREQLLSLKKKTSWSWEKMCREFHRVMDQEGPSHTTLFRYAIGKVKRRHGLTERFVREAIQKVRVELTEKERSERTGEDVNKEMSPAGSRVHHLVENARDFIYRYRVEAPPGYEYVSPAVREIFGYTPEEFYSDPSLIRKRIHPDDQVLLESYLQGDGSAEPVTLRGIHKDGSRIWVEEIIVPVQNEAGNLVAIEGIARDITGRKEFEQALFSVIEGTSWNGAEEFPRSLVQQLAAALQVRVGFLSELDPTRKRARLVAIWEGKGYGKNFEYEIKGTPCEHVFRNNRSYYSDDLQKKFPQDAWLAEKDIESYLAIPVRDPVGNPIGHLGVMDGAPMLEDLPRESILRIFAARVGKALERRRTDS